MLDEVQGRGRTGVYSYGTRALHRRDRRRRASAEDLRSGRCGCAPVGGCSILAITVRDVGGTPPLRGGAGRPRRDRARSLIERARAEWSWHEALRKLAQIFQSTLAESGNGYLVGVQWPLILPSSSDARGAAVAPMPGNVVACCRRDATRRTGEISEIVRGRWLAGVSWRDQRPARRRGENLLRSHAAIFTAPQRLWRASLRPRRAFVSAECARPWFVRGSSRPLRRVCALVPRRSYVWQRRVGRGAAALKNFESRWPVPVCSRRKWSEGGRLQSSGVRLPCLQDEQAVGWRCAQSVFGPFAANDAIDARAGDIAVETLRKARAAGLTYELQIDFERGIEAVGTHVAEDMQRGLGNPVVFTGVAGWLKHAVSRVSTRGDDSSAGHRVNGLPRSRRPFAWIQSAPWSGPTKRRSGRAVSRRLPKYGTAGVRRGGKIHALSPRVAPYVDEGPQVRRCGRMLSQWGTCEDVAHGRCRSARDHLVAGRGRGPSELGATRFECLARGGSAP